MVIVKTLIVNLIIYNDLILKFRLISLNVSCKLSYMYDLP